MPWQIACYIIQCTHSSTRSNELSQKSNNCYKLQFTLSENFRARSCSSSVPNKLARSCNQPLQRAKRNNQREGIKLATERDRSQRESHRRRRIIQLSKRWISCNISLSFSRSLATSFFYSRSCRSLPVLEQMPNMLNSVSLGPRVRGNWASNWL